MAAHVQGFTGQTDFGSVWGDRAGLVTSSQKSVWGFSFWRRPVSRASLDHLNFLTFCVVCLAFYWALACVTLCDIMSKHCIIVKRSSGKYKNLLSDFFFSHQRIFFFQHLRFFSPLKLSLKNELFIRLQLLFSCLFNCHLPKLCRTVRVYLKTHSFIQQRVASVKVLGWGAVSLPWWLTGLKEDRTCNC